MSWRLLLAGASSLASGCVLFADLDATPGGAGGGSTSSAVGPSSGSTTTSGSTGAGGTGAGGAGGTDATSSSTGAGGTGGAACVGEFADTAGTSVGATTSGAGGGGGCAPNTPTDCMACGHDCGPGATCLELSFGVFRCAPANLGVSSDTVRATGIGGGFVVAVEAPENMPSLFRFPVDSPGDTPRDLESASACPTLEDCADRSVAVDASGAAFVGSASKGLLRCPQSEDCAPIPELDGQSVSGLRLDGGVLRFLRTAPSQPDLSEMNLATDVVTTLVEATTIDDAVALTQRGPDLFWTTALAAPPGRGLARRQTGEPITLASGDAAAPPTGIASDGRSIFWRVGDAVLALTTGCAPRTLIASTGAGGPDRKWDIEVDSTFIYFDHGGEGSVWRCAKDEVAGGLPSAEPSCDRLDSGGHLTGDDTWVIYGAGPQLRRVRKAP